MKLSKFFNTKIKIFLLFAVIIGFALRIWQLNTDLLFHTDQGLHSLAIWQIWREGKVSLLGHPTDVDGLIHAPIYYWLMTPSYAVSNGNPVAASIFQISLEMLSLPFLFLALKRLFNKQTAVLTLLLYVFSYGLISYSRWLVNVTPILPFANVFIYLISLQINSRKNLKITFLSSFVVGIIAQLNAAVGIFLFPFLIWFYRKKLNIYKLLTILTAFLLPAAPLVIFQFRHNFVLVKALLKFLKSKESGIGFSFNIFFNNAEILLKQINQITAFPLLIISASFFVLGLIRIHKLSNHKEIYAYLAIPFLVLGIFQRGAIGFFYIAILPLVLAVFIYGLTWLPKKISILIFTIILVLNISNLQKIYKPTNALIPIGNANLITIQDRKNVIDWMYQKSNGKPFSYWTYTIPYFQEYPWDYLLLYYAQPKYGYLPEKTTGFSPKDLKESQYFFNIHEPEYDRLTRQEAWFEELEKNWGKTIEKRQSHDLTVELRSWKLNQ